MTRHWSGATPALPASTGRRSELRNLGLVLGGGILIRRRATPVLQEGDAAQAGVSLALLLATAATLALLALTATLARLALGVAVAVGLLRVGRLAALLRRIALLAFLALAPTLVVARDEAAHGLDQAKIMIGVLPVGFRHDAVARGGRFTRQRLVLVEHLVGVAAHPDVRPARVENLVSIGRTVGIVIVMLLVMVAAATAAATIATAARPLTIVWSH